ncbi:DUF4381 family protein [Frateuria defendens]|uniref:DUF4381 family protein n=1 Tax=Frateuria defendens TaxID=2219559 RepID=UPI00066FCF77|nr:DUF4381 family protein [Frateuria defendens]
MNLADPHAAAQGPLLRDIHLPPAPPWWPPAPGWWALLALLLVLALVGAWRWRRARGQRRLRTRVLAELDALAAGHEGDDGLLAASLHQLLRRMVLRYAPSAVRAHGEAWREALARVPVDAATLEQLALLEQALYRPQRFDRAAMLAAVRAWLAAALRLKPVRRAMAGGPHA